jgi:hypothetical protein
MVWFPAFGQINGMVNMHYFANAMHHKANLYKQNGLIQHTFEDVSINIIPIGGCGGVKYWVNLNLFTKLGKPFFIFLDSDKENAAAISPNETNLIEYGLTNGTDFCNFSKTTIRKLFPPNSIAETCSGLCNYLVECEEESQSLLTI